MPTATLTLSNKEKTEIKSFSWVNWSEIAKEEIILSIKRKKRLQKLDKFLKNSEITEQDLIKWSKKARKGRYKKLKKKGLA